MVGTDRYESYSYDTEKCNGRGLSRVQGIQQ